MTAKVWIEVALNGPWGRERQPGIPVREADIIADGIAAARAGAAIVHLHAYDEETGRQRDDWRIYARLIEGIRAKVDAIVYPTIPIAGSGFAGPATSQSGRYAHLDELGKRGLVEWGVVDPGSVNFASFADIRAGKSGFTYLNPDEHVREGLVIAARHGLRPSYAIYEPGFARLGAALAAAHPGLPTPIYRLMFSDAFAWGLPPRTYALDAYLALLRDCAPKAPVMVAGLGVDIRPLIAPAVERGAHIRVGLEDALFGDGRANAAFVEEARPPRARGGQ
jgi:3-keto-5-aminohexanoate cleavage enzyme